jgi:hypothetical protein
MKFKEFLIELAMPEISSMAKDVAVEEEINRQLEMGLKDVILSPQIGFLKIRKVLRMFNFDIPTSYAIEQEGDEVVLDLLGNTDSLLYVLYYQTDDGNYDFYARVDDEEGIEEIISEDEQLEKE